MMDRGRYRCHRSSGRPEGFGEDASFFFDRAGMGASHPRHQVIPPRVAQPAYQPSRFPILWALLLIGVALSVLILIALAPRLLHRPAAVGPASQQGRPPWVQVISARRGAMLVPLSAVHLQQNEAYVQVVDSQNIVHCRKVLLGRPRLREIEVLAGLDGGENLVAPIQPTLRDGMRVIHN